MTGRGFALSSGMATSASFYMSWFLSFLIAFAPLVAFLLVVSLIVQAIIGVVQSRMGVPPLLVGLHLLGASTIIALLHLQWLFTFGKQR